MFIKEYINEYLKRFHKSTKETFQVMRIIKPVKRKKVE